MSPLLPTDERFFELIAALACEVETCAIGVAAMLVDSSQENGRAAVDQASRAGDELAREITTRLDHTYAAPFEPEDIYAVTARLERLLHAMRATAGRIAVYALPKAPEATAALAHALVDASGQIRSAAAHLRTVAALSARVASAAALEFKAHGIYEAAVGELFDTNPDVLVVLKLKDIYDHLEDAIDRCHRVARFLERVAIKHG